MAAEAKVAPVGMEGDSRGHCTWQVMKQEDSRKKPRCLAKELEYFLSFILRVGRGGKASVQRRRQRALWGMGEYEILHKILNAACLTQCQVHELLEL